MKIVAAVVLSLSFGILSAAQQQPSQTPQAAAAPASKKLPTPDEAAKAAAAKGVKPDEIQKARQDAEDAEWHAIKDGNFSAVQDAEFNRIEAEKYGGAAAAAPDGALQGDDCKGNGIVLARCGQAPASQDTDPAWKREADTRYCDAHPLAKGSTTDHVLKCLGEPDRVNSDLYSAQWVYGNGTYVYIDRRTDRVQNIQWTN